MVPYTPRHSPKYGEALSAEALRRIFRDAADLVERPVTEGVTAFFLDGLTSGEDISRFLLQPVLREPLPRESGERLRSCRSRITGATLDLCGDLDTACAKLVNGFCLLVFRGSTEALACEVKTGEKRSPAPPEVENTVKGAKDSFTETLRTNTGLLRRHLRCPELQLRETVVGRRSMTNVTVVSLRGLTDPRLPESVLRRLDAIDVDGLTSPAAVEEYLTGSRKTPFPLLRYTERADWFSRGILDGQVGVLVDGLPLGYLLPVNVGLLMTSPEDRGTDYVSATCVRIVRYCALLLALLLPALYLAMARFHPAMIPTPLLHAIIRSKEQVPFSIIGEILGLLAAFELLQEAGLHLPQSIGHTVSIIGGLVVGTAAVEASLISPAALIVVSVSGICGFALPDQSFANALRVWRFVLAVCAALCGLFGLTMGTVTLLVHLGTLHSCGRPYLSPFSDLRPGGAMIRRPLSTTKYRDAFLTPRDLRNQR